MGSRQRRKYADLSKPRTKWDLTCELPEVGLRLDQFLVKRIDWKSRSDLQGWVDEGRVLVNGRKRKSSTRLRERDNIVIAIDPPTDQPDPATIPIEVLSEDADLLAILKEPGIVVHPTSGHTLFNVLSALHARYRNMDDPELDRVPHICHRIDKETSGVLLFAFCEKIKADVSLQFEARTVKKQYLALVEGVPDAEGEVEAPILHRRTGWPRLIIDDVGLPSRTSWRVEESFGDIALVRFFPHTGRTHQIRVHSAHMGFPLVCDETYGGRRPLLRSSLNGERPFADEEPLLDRVALHSTRLEIRHPRTGEQTVFEAPPPQDMQSVLEALRRRGPAEAVR